MYYVCWMRERRPFPTVEAAETWAEEQVNLWKWNGSKGSPEYAVTQDHSSEIISTFGGSFDSLRPLPEVRG